MVDLERVPMTDGRITIDNLPDSSVHVHAHAQSEMEQALDAMPDLMSRVNAIATDVDKVILKGGRIPMTKNGNLDIPKLHEQSPYTIPILELMNEFTLYGIPAITITGKSGTAVLLDDLRRRMFFEQASQKGMLQVPYHVELDSSGINFSDIHVKSEFLDPKTGRMMAIDASGNPSTKRLALLFAARDNGGSRDEYWPGGSHDVSQFPRAFYETLLRDDIQSLLTDSTKKSKTERLQNIEKVFYNLPDITELEKKSINELTDDELWKVTAKKSIGFSYASPSHGAKFNLELDMEKVLTDSSLKERWTNLLRSLTSNQADEVTDDASVRKTLELLFPKNVATVTLNFVDEGNTGMGKRVVIDLNPPGVNKLYGFQKMVESMNAIYEQAGLQPPDFLHDSVRMGDGPDKNDKELLEPPGGWTNTHNPHEKVKGFPADSIPLLNKFDIQVKDGETLEDTEQTYLFLRLVAFCRFRKLLDGIPQDLRQKIIIPTRYQSM